LQPFAGEPRAVVVLPSSDPSLGGKRALLELELAAFEAELGAPVELREADPGDGARLVLSLAEGLEGPPTMSYDAGGKLLEARAADVGGILEALNLVRTAVRLGGEISPTDCGTLDEAIERVVIEVAETYPAFGLRCLDWEAICARHLGHVARAGEDPLPELQRWLAELEDGHTWVWPALGNLPYAVRLGEDSTFVRLRVGSAGWEAGVRPGWPLTAVDGGELSAADWLSRAAAPPHSRPLVAGRRLLAGPVGGARELTALSPGGVTVTWEDTPTPRPEDPLVSWSRLDGGVGYLRVEAWVGDAGVDEAVGAAFDELRTSESLVLDLPGTRAATSCSRAAHATGSCTSGRCSARSATARAAAGCPTRTSSSASPARRPSAGPGGWSCSRTS
jgi:carboxyl-terminal processing protease